MRALAVAIVVHSAPAYATDVKGFAELRGSYAAGVDGTPWTLVQRFRPEIEVDLGPKVVLGATVEAALREGRSLQTELQRTLEASELAPDLEGAGCVWPTHRNETFGIDRAGDYLDVQRLYIDYYHPRFDLRAGRQALQWGSAILINPTDPFPQVLFVEPWRPRAGVNAARVSVPFGTGSNQIQAVIATDDVFRYGRGAIRGTVNVDQTDISVIGAYRGDSESGVIGLDVKGTLGVGFWLEGALHVGPAAAPGPADPTPPPGVYEELAIGVDYSFAVLETLLIGAQYYRNGAGEADFQDYAPRTSQGTTPPDCDNPAIAAVFAGGEPDPFAPFFAGTDYGLVQVALNATQDLSVSGVVLQNMRDGSGIAVPVVKLTPSGTTEVAATAQIPYRAWGRTGEFKPAPQELVLHVPGLLGDQREVDLGGMVPDVTVTVWTRLSF